MHGHVIDVETSDLSKVTSVALSIGYIPAQWDVSIGYIPAQRDIRPVISRGKGQCLSEAEEVLRAQPETLPRLHESTELSQGI